jgi:hypothetical protein
MGWRQKHEEFRKDYENYIRSTPEAKEILEAWVEYWFSGKPEPTLKPTRGLRLSFQEWLSELKEPQYTIGQVLLEKSNARNDSMRYQIFSSGGKTDGVTYNCKDAYDEVFKCGPGFSIMTAYDDVE